MIEERLDLDSLVSKLRSSVDAKLWYQFGTAIGVPKDILEMLKGYDGEQCMIELADYWLKNHPAKPTWSEVNHTARRFMKQIEMNDHDYAVPQDITTPGTMITHNN